jgi:TonB family protein
VPAADPAVMSDSESDPFTKTKTAETVVFKDGRVEARFGRKVKTIRPHLSFSSQMDLMSMQFPRLVVRVHIHTDGSVRRVDIIKSTGSPGADQEVKVALYQWWFEPTKETEVEFPIVWR